MRALIQGTSIIELAEEAFEVHKDLKWVIIPMELEAQIDTVSWGFINNQFTDLRTLRNLAETKAEKIAEIKKWANEKILTIAPIWKQNNIQADVSVIHDKQLDGETLTIEEQAIKDKAKTIRLAIEAIRTTSNALETQIIAATTLNDVDAIDIADSW